MIKIRRGKIHWRFATTAATLLLLSGFALRALVNLVPVSISYKEVVEFDAGPDDDQPLAEKLLEQDSAAKCWVFRRWNTVRAVVLRTTTLGRSRHQIQVIRVCREMGYTNPRPGDETIFDSGAFCVVATRNPTHP